MRDKKNVTVSYIMSVTGRGDASGRVFTNYISPGLYANYLERVFKTPNDTLFRHFMQDHPTEVLRVTNALTVTHVKPPKMPKSTLKVKGGANAHMTEGQVGGSDRILPRSYLKDVARFNSIIRGG
jgi:hypothetical protein